jgi:hypothetical protein
LSTLERFMTLPTVTHAALHRAVPVSTRAAFAALGRLLIGVAACIAGGLLAVGVAKAQVPAGAEADPPGRVGRLADTQGPVWLFDIEQGNWAPALRNRPVTSGDRLSTGADARAEVRIGSSTFTLAAGTELEFSRVDDERLRVQLHRGSVAVRLRSRDVAAEAELVTAEALLRPLRGGFYRLDREDDTTFASAWRGELRVDDPYGFEIDAGRRVQLWREGPQRQLRQRAQAEIDYRRGHGYPSVLGQQNSEELLQRLSVLKKYTSSVLWLSTSTRREGGTLEQVLFASAAGVSMIFATLVAFYAQSVYGQLSLPVFLVLVIAYMFKDRIKELGRAFSTHILSRRLYDYRTRIQTQDGERDLGCVRDKMIHVRPQGRERTVPPEVMAARQGDPHYEPELLGRPEVVIHYAKQVTLRKDAFRYLAEDGLVISAINDITRLDIRSFLRKMDNPYEERLMLQDGRVEHVRCQRTYLRHRRWRHHLRTHAGCPKPQRHRAHRAV